MFLGLLPRRGDLCLMNPCSTAPRRLQLENMNPITYKSTSGFEKDLKRLLKKFRSLEEDLELVKLATIEPYHVGVLLDGIMEKKDANAIFTIQNFCSDELKICKIKKF